MVMHNPTLLGVSLLLLSCASPTLSSSTESPIGALDAASAPSSPVLGFNPSFSPFNPGSSALPAPVSEPSNILVASDLASPTPTTGSESLGSVNAFTATAMDIAATTGAPGSADLSQHSTTPSLAVNQNSDHTSPTGLASVFAASSSASANTHVAQLPVATSPVPVQAMKHSTGPSSAHKKLASKFKAINPSPPAEPPVASVDSTTSTAQSSINSPTTQALASESSVPQESMAATFTVPRFSTTRMVLDPTSDVLDDPNPDQRSQSVSEASERARRRSILAALLILGTLGALGGGILCFKCGVLPCCHSRQRRHRKSRTSLEHITEEGLRKHPRVASTEKSIIPGAPPVQFADMPTLSRDSHALSCSTCPDSMNGMRSGISGHVADWRVYATNEDGHFEDVTHILSSDAFSVRSADDTRTRRASAGSWSQRHSADSTGSGVGSEPESAAHSHTGSRTSGSGASMTAESYKSCESRYSTPSFERHSRDGPPPASPSGSSSLSLRSPSPPTSVSVLLRTPEQADYVGLADAALPRVVDVAVTIPSQLPNVSESETEDMDLDSQWDVAGTYGALEDKKPMDAELGKKLPAAVERGTGTVDLGGRTCVLMRG